jgi:hypothetical protein
MAVPDKSGHLVTLTKAPYSHQGTYIRPICDNSTLGLGLISPKNKNSILITEGISKQSDFEEHYNF